MPAARLDYSAAFLALMATLGYLHSWWAILAWPVTVLVGFAFGGAGMALTTFMRSWQDFQWVQLAILPMFLFSATFFPLDHYAPGLRWVVRVTPLYQAVNLVRSLCLGNVTWSLLVPLCTCSPWAASAWRRLPPPRHPPAPLTPQSG